MLSKLWTNCKDEDKLTLPLEDLYGITKKDVELTRVITPVTGRPLDTFKAPGSVLVEIEFPEFTCRCPKTGHPDFATLRLLYIPNKICIELKSLKFYWNSFRDEGHFHEQVMVTMEKDLRGILSPIRLAITGDFNVRGGTHPVVEVGDFFECEE